jgi:hypothetical protein
MPGDQPPGLGPASRPVLAAVRQAGEAAELVRGIGHRNRTEPGFPAVFGHRCEISPEPRPAGEPVLAGDDQLRGGKRQATEVVRQPTGVVAGQPRDRAGVAGPEGSLEGTGLPTEAVKVGTVGHGQGRHDDLLSSACGPLRQAERRTMVTMVHTPGGLGPFPRTGGFLAAATSLADLSPAVASRA